MGFALAHEPDRGRGDEVQRQVQPEGHPRLEGRRRVGRSYRQEAR